MTNSKIIEIEEVLLRIFIGENDSYEGKTLYEQIVIKAKESNISGATVIRGIMGYGASAKMHSAKILRLTEDLPIIVEIIDSEENINKIIPFLDEMITEGVVTTEKINVRKYTI